MSWLVSEADVTVPELIFNVAPEAILIDGVVAEVELKIIELAVMLPET
jgi:hypothetical protein